MICSYLENSNYAFIELHTEQVYSFVAIKALNSFKNKDNYTVNSDKVFPAPPIHTKVLTKPTLQKIIEFCISKEELPENFILDFKGITLIDKNLISYFDDLLIELFKKKSRMTIINFSMDLSQNRDNYYFFNPFVLSQKKKPPQLDGNPFEEKQLISIKEELLNEQIRKKFNQNLKPNDSPFHPSSSVYLSHYFNFNHFISESTFIYYCLYLLAKKMISKNVFHDWEIVPREKIILFCQTLNGAFIGSILSDLLGVDLFVIDHLGPNNKIYSNKLYGKLCEDQKYIVVSDVVCLGTEVKNAKSIIEYSGAKYVGNVALLRTESIRKSHRNFHDIEFFYRITSENKPQGFKILTDFDKTLDRLLNKTEKK